MNVGEELASQNEPLFSGVVADSDRVGDGKQAATADDLSNFKMFLMTLGQLGSIFAWSMEFSLTTPFFEKSLGASKELSHAVWLIGPISGIIMGVLIGALSDRTGKRKPFIVGFLIMSIIALVSFGQSTKLWTAVMTFGLCDFAINGTMWPLRALFSDSVSLHQQHAIQSWAAVNGALGDMLASLFVWSLGEPVAKMGIAMSTTAVVLGVTTVCSVFFGRENFSRDQCGSRSASGEPLEGTRDDLFVDIDFCPSPLVRPLNRLARVVTGQELSSIPLFFLKHASVFGIVAFSFFCITPNLSSWFATAAFAGDPSAPASSPAAMRYEQGVALFALANAFKSIAGLVFSLAYPGILRRLGTRTLFTGTYGVLAVVLFAGGIFGNGNPVLAFAVVVFTSIPFAVAFTVTAAIIVEHYTNARGTFLGVLNLFNVIPQLIDTLYTGRIARLYGEAAVVGYFGAGWAFAGAAAAWFAL